jgi:uncharacterized protein (TIGR00251 family)
MNCLSSDPKSPNTHCLVRVKISPKASKNKILGLHGTQELKIAISAIPEKGKANTELKNFLAETFQVSRSDVEIVKGETSKSKVFRLNLSIVKASSRLNELI